MHVLVTGGTGFVGSHVVEALLDAGHTVRVLARTPEKVAAVLGARGYLAGEALEVARGDMTDAAAVGRALDGVDAVVHAAATVGVAGGDLAATAANVEGTRTVVGLAAEAGCDPIVYASSVAVLYPAVEPVLHVDSPLATPISEYGRSKVESERYVRSLQSQRAPVVSLLIGGVYGPGQLQPDSAMRSILAALQQMMVVTSGGVGVLDVRDLAQVVLATLEPGRGPRRYLVGGRFLDWASWTDQLEAVVGRPIRRAPVPARLMTTLGRGIDLAMRVRPFDYPLTYEAALFMTSAVPADDAPTFARLGVARRPVAETLADATRWLIERGDLDPKLAPALA